MMIKHSWIALVLAGCTAGASAGFGSSTTASAGTSSDDSSGTTLDNNAWSPPGHWSMKEKEAWNLLRDELGGYVKTMNANCGTKIAVELDYETYRGKFKSDERYGLDAYGRAHMSAPISAIDDLCKKGGNERTAIAGSIQKVIIAHNAERTKSTVELASGTLRASFDPEIESASSYYDTATDWIAGHI